MLWGWAVTNPEGAFFPRQMGLNKEKFYFSFPESLGFRKRGEGRDSKDGACPPEQNSCALQQSPLIEKLAA